METDCRMSLQISGADGDERWQSLIITRPDGGQSCCETGHFTPEAAAQHGAEKAAAAMCRAVRRLPASTYGGSILARAS